MDKQKTISHLYINGMNKSGFLNKASVQEFVEWITPRLDQPGSLVHFYNHKQSKTDWICDSIYSAYENYNWKSKGFYENKQILDALSGSLKKAISDENNTAAINHCIGILEWGGVLRGNRQKIEKYGDSLTTYLKKVTRLLHPNLANINNSYDGVEMNSGFTKIYSLIIDDFVIYDSRVGAALGMLVLRFCQERKRQEIPEELLFAYGSARGDGYGISNRRNPGDETFKFPILGSSAEAHIKHNLRANWLLKEILMCSKSKFSGLRELEAALFMIGYDVQCSKRISI